MRNYTFLSILILFISCKTTITNNLECDIDFGIDESNLGDIKINYIKKDFKDEFIYYQYVLEKCPGYLSTNCLRYYIFYSEGTIKIKESIVKSNNCFLLSENQKYILPTTDYTNFLKRLPNIPIKNELLDKLNKNNELANNIITKIDKKGKRELLKVKVKNIDVYEFEMNTEQLNYYFRPSGAIFTYSAFPAQKTKVLILVPTESKAKY